MHAVWLLSAVAVIFWLTAQQAGSSLTVFAAMNTLPSVTLLGQPMLIGPGHFVALHGLLVLAMLPAFLALHGRQTGRAPSATSLMIWGYVATAGAFALMAWQGFVAAISGRVSGAWPVGCYLLLSLAEVLCPLGVSLLTQLAPKPRRRRPWGCGLRALRSAMAWLARSVCVGTVGRITATSRCWRRCRLLPRSRCYHAADIWTGSPRSRQAQLHNP